MNCLTNLADPKVALYCQTCRKVVALDEAAMYCYGAGHEIVEAKDELFGRGQ